MATKTRTKYADMDLGGRGRFIGGNGVGRAIIQFDVANYEDMAMARRGLLEPEKVRRATIGGVVDSGATQLVLPGFVVKKLGLNATGKRGVRYADGRRATRDRVEGVYVEIMGRHETFSAIVEPRRKNALLGVIVLEAMDFLVDCQKEKIFPRDPRIEIHEIE